MKIRSFRENSLGDKCPVCKLINVNLIDVGRGILGSNEMPCKGKKPKRGKGKKNKGKR